MYIGPFCVFRGLIQEQQDLGLRSGFDPPDLDRPGCHIKDQLTLRVKPRGPGVIVVAASGLGDNVLSQARAEWTTMMRERQQQQNRVTWLTDLLEHDWPELLQGTTATRMIQRMVNEGLAYEVQVRDTFVVIFPETTHRAHAAARRSSEFEVATWSDQLGSIEDVGKEIKRFTARKAASVSLMDILAVVQELVHTKSITTAQVRVEDALDSSICILPGMQAVQEQGQLVMQYAGQNVAGAGGVPDLREVDGTLPCSTHDVHR